MTAPLLTSRPTFSIITVSYNQGEFIRQNIESVLAQNYPQFEHIVVDGGSTDSTLDVLRQYPHLRWTSAPDRGQTHALNMGFSRATGDIIGWLNSDDWYAPDIFAEVAERLSRYPVVMGGCQVADREGRPTELIPNVGRNWYDILKYWIFYSSPAQPSIFFRRELLEQSKRPDGSYLDEELHFCMDYELWLRMARRAPFVEQSRTTYSFFRNYDTNKTGQDMDSTYREAIRVFRRHAMTQSEPGYAMSYILPVRELSSDVFRTVENLQAQALRDYEILIVHYGADAASARAVRKDVLGLDRKLQHSTLRYLNSYANSFQEAVHHGVTSGAGWLGTVLEPGAELETSFTQEAVNLFSQAIIGAAFPSRGEGLVAESLAKEDPQRAARKVFNIDGLFAAAPHRANFVYRKLALLELNGLPSASSPLLAFRELLLRLVYKGWHISVDNLLGIIRAPEAEEISRDVYTLFDAYVNSQIIANLSEERETDLFAVVREQHGFSLSLPEALIAQAKSALTQAPADWHQLNYLHNTELLQKLVTQYPHFAPFQTLLARRQS